MPHPVAPLFLPRSAAARAPVWQLAAGQAAGLQAHAVRELRVTQGRVWVTLGGGVTAGWPAAGWPVSGDVVMRPGEVLQVPAGAHVVVESWPETGGLPARFEWAPPARVGLRPAVGAGGLTGWAARLQAVRWVKSTASPGVLPHMGCGG